jgi:HEAT repeat protein
VLTKTRIHHCCLALCLLLAGCGANPTDTAILQLQSSDVEVRRAAARTLDERTPPDVRAIPGVTKALADSDREVRWLSIDIVAKIGAPASSSLPALIQALDDAETAVRVRAALAIQKIDPKSAEFQRVLIAEMRAGDGRVFLDVGAMGKDAAWAISTLTQLLSHQSPKIRALAAYTLGQIGPTGSDANLALQRAAADPNPAVQSAARDAIKNLKSDKRVDVSSSKSIAH